MDEGDEHKELLGLTSEIVASFASKNAVASTDLPTLIKHVFQALRSAGEVIEATSPEAPVPAVPVKKSITPEYIVCLEDGQKMRMLKRHLATHHHTTPAAYRERWGLPLEYPMVAPAYAEARAAIAKSSGLGRHPKRLEAVAEPTPDPLPGKPARRIKRAKAEA